MNKDKSPSVANSSKTGRNCINCVGIQAGLGYSEFGYDEIGNSTDWAANSLNQYAQFAYDPDGNLLSDGVRNLLLRRLEPRRGARRLRERKDYYACRFHLPALIRWFFRRVRASAKVLKSPP